MKKKLREKVWHKYNERCAYCGNKLEYNKMQVDHINPKYKGGANDILNYNPSCRACNFYKGTFTIDEFRQNLQTLHERFEKIFIIKMAIRYRILKYKPFENKFYYENKDIH